METNTVVVGPNLGLGERNASLSRGRATKRLNALTALLCGGVSGALLEVAYPSSWHRFAIGFLVGLLWSNTFEYIYHRYVLHLGVGFFARQHLVHHTSVGKPNEAEHLTLGGTALGIVLLFIANGVPLVIVDRLLGLGVAPAMLMAFALYVIAYEEIHWRIHLGGWLPSFMGSSVRHHMQHHASPETRFNVFLPVFDRLLGTDRG